MKECFIEKLNNWYGPLNEDAVKVVKDEGDRVIVLVSMPLTEDVELVRMWINTKQEVDISIDETVDFNEVSAVDAIYKLLKRFSEVA